MGKESAIYELVRSDRFKTALHKVAHAFISKRVPREQRLFDLCWDSMKDQLAESPSKASSLVDLLPRSPLAHYKGSPLASVLCISTLSQLFVKLSERDFRRDKRDIKDELDKIAKVNGVPDALRAKMVKHIVPLICDAGFLDSLRGTLIEEIKIYLNGKEKWVRESSLNKMLTKPSSRLVIDRNTSELRVFASSSKHVPVKLIEKHFEILSRLCSSEKPLKAEAFRDLWSAEQDLIDFERYIRVILTEINKKLRVNAQCEGAWVESAGYGMGQKMSKLAKNYLVVTEKTRPMVK